ncbi:MAG: DUF2071 domain-containing protein [Flavobacteriales bacterium]|jgi:uncharacterized protein YqjF (DUF2071 family)|nr:DUF2071 domain-containing protein [Flavobacteriales bacterium]
MAERRPPAAFLTAEWRKLAMVNYAVDPDMLRPFVPHGTEPDLFNGTCHVSLVGFLFARTRLKGVPVPFHTRFPEVNLRFYVRHRSAEGWRRGVVFIREFVPKPALALVARGIYGEPYRTVPMAHRWRHDAQGLEVAYRWKRRRWHGLAVQAGPTAAPMVPGGEEEFIAEHYWGYTRRGPQRTMAYGVEHPPWAVYPVRGHTVDVDFGLLYGDRFATLGRQRPASVLLAEGSPVVVRAGRWTG